MVTPSRAAARYAALTELRFVAPLSLQEDAPDFAPSLGIAVASAADLVPIVPVGGVLTAFDELPADAPEPAAGDCVALYLDFGPAWREGAKNRRFEFFFGPLPTPEQFADFDLPDGATLDVCAVAIGFLTL